MCLYNSPAFVDSLHNRIFDYMVENTTSKFAAITTHDEAVAAWTPIFKKYNMTKRGLRAEGYEFDEVEYDDFIRADMEQYVFRNEELIATIRSMPQARKYVLTNSPERHARRCLELIGVADCFQGVFGTDFMAGRCKPELSVYEKVLSDVGVGEDARGSVCYFEDSFKNLAVGKSLGFRAVFVKNETMEEEGRTESELAAFDAVCDKVVNNEDLRRHASWLWDDTSPS
jgi:pyrimidine 5'-nucleotidase